MDFVDLKYRPSVDDVICEFQIEEAAGISLKEAAGGIAAESSIGTWTQVTTEKSYVKELGAKVFEIDGKRVKIAYPIRLFELGNLPNLLSSVAGNVYGLKELKHLRLEDIQIPSSLAKSFRGPRFGIEGVRKLVKVYGRPLLGAIIKPKLGLKAADHANVAYESWVGGCDIVKDDENLSSQDFNRFETRVSETLEKRDKAQEEVGEKKVYLPNVSAETEDMLRRAEYVKDLGGESVMIDVITCGASALQSLRNRDLGLVIHAHRAGHGALTRVENHGIAMKVIARLVRMVGVDQLHIGTAVGKMSESQDEVLENIKVLKEPFHGLKPVMPVASGGLHPILVPDLIKIFDKDFIIQAGGGIHGHPDGTIAGATAMRQAIDATLHGISLIDYANDHVELKKAMSIWMTR
ncbi:type III ribulose-bisphosphate carboxylase [Candidatus Bathyarchaeota archaeon]|nr:type III ribulose-bisphosphate carboxylase [Candidatus Bathyarchaeota archaeon]